MTGHDRAHIGDDLSVDFKVITQPGAERIIRMAFEYAKKNNIKKVTVVTKPNVVKTTDGRFSKTAKEIADLLNMSPRTIDTHRYHIRKKLGLKSKKTNLRTYLMSFE